MRRSLPAALAALVLFAARAAGASEAAEEQPITQSAPPEPALPARFLASASGYPYGEAGPPSRGHADAEPAYSIAMPWGESRFESLRAAYMTEGGRKWLEAILARSRPFMTYIADRIRHYGLPDELAFLPVIESEFSSRNVSKSGAAGLWQFMHNSIAGYGMKIDDWVDERRDFMKSTDGALRKLRDNYAALGDWPLALAAYNAGLGAVTRSRAKAKAQGIAAPDYWKLREMGLLPAETVGYVPKFLAVASILRYPGRHGLTSSWEPPSSWEAIPARRPVDLALLAQAAGLSLELLRAGNAELRYNVTPPSNYSIKVPASDAARVRAILDDPSRELVRYYLHVVRSGDTVSGVSRRYGTPVSAIVQSNPGMKPDYIMLGQVIVVPALKDPPAEEEKPAATEEPPAFDGFYKVAKGDTLWSISLKYEVQPELLAEANGLNLLGVIRDGMNLRVPILR
ncbi:MAG: LysM peptidoglycan-binding domain-containing protein [Spirochaetaceae bacterium]|nr:LysM peptidoglycan-binding domain-containing protein [Spirochaetaceae bacterium]